MSFCSRTTYDDNAITNAVEIYDNSRCLIVLYTLFAISLLNIGSSPSLKHCSGAVHFMASNNDCGVRDFDMEKFQFSKHFHFEWPVNVSHKCSCFS